MRPVEAAIIGTAAEKRSLLPRRCRRRTFLISVGRGVQSPWIGCRGTDACGFANSVTQPIRSHSTHGVFVIQFNL